MTRRPFGKVLAIISAILTVILLTGCARLFQDDSSGRGDKATESQGSDSGKNDSGQLVLSASPLDVAHVTAVSKFRSCSGHDYSPGVSKKGGEAPDSSLESGRSMKNYIQTDLPPTPADSLEIFAPAGGKIQIWQEQVEIGKQVVITDGQWEVHVFHIDPTVADGATVKAGDLIGHIPPVAAATDKSYSGENGQTRLYEFDISVISGGSDYVPMFDYMDNTVAAQWATRGFSAQNTTITRAERDAHPCEVGPDGEYFTEAAQKDPNNWVQASS